jgi:hypothetical protein
MPVQKGINLSRSLCFQSTALCLSLCSSSVQLSISIYSAVSSGADEGRLKAIQKSVLSSANLFVPKESPKPNKIPVLFQKHQMGAAVETNSDLKRLNFIKSYSIFALDKTYSIASNLYTTGKGYAPSSLEPRIKAVEEKVTEVGSPLVSKLQDRSDTVLHTLDSKVSLCGLLRCVV